MRNSNHKFAVARRQRVSGQGPKRQQLPSFKKILDAPKSVLEEVIGLADQFEDSNDLYSDQYEISKHCELRKKVCEGHKNLLLQVPILGSDGMDQNDYQVWDKLKPESHIKSFLLERFSGCFRARIAVLPPGGQIDWHIDLSTAVSCRFQLLVKNDGFQFEINRRGSIESIPFREGELYFTNTAFPHRVVNPTDYERISLLFDIQHFAIADLLPPLS
jgi:hypothetical protein